MRLPFFVLATVCLWTAVPGRPAASAPARDGTVRQTAKPWDGPADEFEYPGREKTLKIHEVMDDLKLGPGSQVADIGAGGGWLTVRLSKRVGGNGRVYAQEILPKYINYIRRRADKQGLKNVVTVLGTTKDPKLPRGTLDAAVILNAYHEFDAPLTMLNRIHASIKPGGLLGIIERDDETLRQEARDAYAKTGKILRRVDEKPGGAGYTDDHRLAREIVEREAATAGFVKVSERELEGDIYLVVLQRK